MTDQDKLQKHSCQLIDSSSNRFVIVNREVRVSSNANLDYESQGSHTIRVNCTDNGTPPLSKTKSFTVKVLDVNEKPTMIHISHDEVARYTSLLQPSPANGLVFVYRFGRMKKS